MCLLGMGSTMQGIVGAAFEGAGVAIGSLVGGAVYKAKVGYLSLYKCQVLYIPEVLIHFI